MCKYEQTTHIVLVNDYNLKKLHRFINADFVGRSKILAIGVFSGLFRTAAPLVTADQQP